MTGKIFRSILLAAGSALLASLLIIMGCLYDYFGGVQEKQLREALSLAASGVETAGADYLADLAGGNYRLTWIAADGSVLYDDEADEKSMENHADREEVRQALADGEGESERYSSTLLQKTLYRAQRLSDGTVLRISVSRATMALLVMGMVQPILLVALLALFLALFLAKRLSRRIVEPLNALDLDHPLENKTYDELTPLLRRIHQQRRQIERQMRELKQKSDEFAQITASMNEGLLLLDRSGTILSINPAAQRLFGADETAAGQNFLAVERSPECTQAVSRALREGRSEICMERGGRIYQLDMSAIRSEGAIVGVVLLTFDVTEKSSAERSRREFTANVSHELKTPLTSILGSAELIENGLVKDEDLPRFVGHIHAEAARLLSLIEDILRLSQLDEGAPQERETFDLAAVAAEAAEQLSEKAAQQNVTICVESEPCPIAGVKRLSQEIAQNLIENAVKYNVSGGTVRVCVAASGVLTVADTGIGIPPEHRERIFERFYRVDKSHSKQIGGTGLGLSIVKHACAYLDATVELQSEVGKGTTIVVQFPKEND